MLVALSSFILLLIITVLYIVSSKRFEKELEGIDSKEYKIIQFIPASLFLLEDIFHYKYHHKIDNVLRQKLLLLYPTREIDLRLRLHWGEKIGYALLVITAASLLSLLLSFNSHEVMDSNIIQRPSYNEKDIYVDVEANLSVSEEQKTKEYSILIPKQLPDQETAEKILVEAVSQLPEVIRGRNESLERVMYPLNLVQTYPDTDIEVNWQIDNPSLINKKGELYLQGINDTGEAVTLVAALKYLGLEETKVIEVTLVPLELTPDEKLSLAENELEDLLMQPLQGQEESNQIILPEKLDDMEVSIHWKKKTRLPTSIRILLLGFAGGILIFIGKDYELKKKIDIRNTQIRRDLPDLVNKLNLLINAGMNMSRAWNKIVYDYIKAVGQGKIKEKVLYEQMKITIQEIKNGVPETRAFEAFGKRCGIPEMLRFSTLLIQNLKKGNETLVQALYEQSKETWMLRKSIAIKLGERASAKLLLPMGIMLVIILIIVIVPALMNLRI